MQYGERKATFRILILMKKNNELRIALLFLGPFPIGNVSSLRIMSYCKALAHSGVFVKVLLLAPTTESAVNRHIKGEIDGIQYEYLNGITWKKANPSKFTKLLAYLIGLYRALIQIKRNKINCVLSYHDEFLSTSFFWVVTKILGLPFIIDKTEYPQHYFKSRKIKRAFVNFRLTAYDAFITITKELQCFYTDILKSKTNACFLLPMTINPTRFDSIFKKPVAEPYIAVVFGTHNRDGLFDSIRAYKRYLKMTKFLVPMNMLLIGDFKLLCEKHPECKQIENYIKKHHLEGKIILKGSIPIENVPNLLINASCLLTTPRQFVSGGFPTKLGEYLLSGVPVVATSAGEIGHYVTDREHLYLSLPEEIDQIAQNIIHIEQYPEEALKIAMQGKLRAKAVFNASTYVSELIKFLNYHRSVKQ